MRKFVRMVTTAFMLLMTLQLFAQESTISGTVVSDDQGKVLEGVTVSNEKTNKSTITGDQGTFSIRATRGDVLVFSYIGF